MENVNGLNQKRGENMEKLIEKINIRTLFTQYDIFAYFIPGITFILGIFYYEFRLFNEIKSDSIHIPIYHGITEIFKNVSTLNWILSFFFIIVSISLIYATGHIVSSASSLFIDRALVYKGYGYPYEYLLNYNGLVCQDHFASVNKVHLPVFHLTNFPHS